MSTIKAVLTDIEGTTTDIAFVHTILFPYARAQLPAYVRDHASDPWVQAQLQAVAAEAGTEMDDEQAIATLLSWIDADRKATALKALQGRIWEVGYANGDFQGHVYADAVAGLRRWHAAGLALYVYSSGSVQAQQLLFAHTALGDLTPLFSGYFDTRIGHKREPDAYIRIAEQLQLPAAQLLFLSDVVEELDAAAAAGMATAHLLRDAAQAEAGRHACHASFDRILPGVQAS